MAVAKLHTHTNAHTHTRARATLDASYLLYVLWRNWTL
jgi:hypothetical protein